MVCEGSRERECISVWKVVVNCDIAKSNWFARAGIRNYCTVLLLMSSSSNNKQWLVSSSRPIEINGVNFNRYIHQNPSKATDFYPRILPFLVQFVTVNEYYWNYKTMFQCVSHSTFEYLIHTSFQFTLYQLFYIELYFNYYRPIDTFVINCNNFIEESFNNPNKMKLTFNSVVFVYV